MKILISIPSPEYYRNYITSPALSEIIESCYFIVPKKMADKDFGVPKSRVAVYDYPADKEVLHKHLFHINTGKFESRSTSLKFRFMRLSKRSQVLYRILGLPVIYELTRFFILSRADDRRLFSVIKSIQPDVILMPSSGYEGITFEIIKTAKKQGVPTLMLVDKDDVEIHGIPKERIFPIGTPRFFNYFKNRSEYPSPYPFKYALFAGNSTGFDELSALKKLEEYIEKNNLDLKIVYRPHPMRQKRKCPDNFVESEFKHVVLDLQAKEYYNREKSKTPSDLPDLDYYPRALANMEFMICPLSTMLIECLLFDKPVFVLAYDDGIHFVNPKNLYKYCRHFEGIEYLRNLEIIHEFEDLTRVFTVDFSKKRMEKEIPLSYYLSEKTRHYPHHVKLLVEDINAKFKNNLRVGPQE